MSRLLLPVQTRGALVGAAVIDVSTPARRSALVTATAVPSARPSGAAVRAGSGAGPIAWIPAYLLPEAIAQALAAVVGTTTLPPVVPGSLDAVIAALRLSDGQAPGSATGRLSTGVVESLELRVGATLCRWSGVAREPNAVTGERFYTDHLPLRMIRAPRS